MSKEERIILALGNISDKYIEEAFYYKKKNNKYSRGVIYGIAACLLICVIANYLFFSAEKFSAVTVYAYETGEKFEFDKPVLMSGIIDDNGTMVGKPLMFYVLGDEIEKITYSCDKQYISFMDWTEKRENYGYSKEFTIEYGGDESDYYYLVVDWEPWFIIRKLTDNKEIGIEDLSEDEKHDRIEMEITYQNHKTEKIIIEINLTDEGNFEAEIYEEKI